MYKLKGASIDLSTCVSAARLKIHSGLYFLIIFFNFDFIINIEFKKFIFFF